MFKEDIAKIISDSLTEACIKIYRTETGKDDFPIAGGLSVQATRDPVNGDLTTNAAMRLASMLGRKPSDLAEELVPRIKSELKNYDAADDIGNVEAKKGFINFYLSDGYFNSVLEYVSEQGANYGSSACGKGKRVNIEFVSANPTGPLTIAHGRQAAIGDSLSRILRFSGFDVDREYYLNDCGRQIDLLGKSLAVRYKNLFGGEDPLPEDGYMGEYVIGIAEEVREKFGDSKLSGIDKDVSFFRSYAVDAIMKMIREDLDAFGVSFDIWKPQSDIERENAVEEVLDALAEKRYIYEKEGARWFASSGLGDDKDRVVVKSDGSYTYLAPDIAYHCDKYKRGYFELIDLLGPDHHGYIKRMKAAAEALGHDKDSLKILIVQLVTLLRNGEAVSMSTRRGEFVSLRELIDELGKDVTRFFFLSRKLDSHLDFDIELAKKESAENPVYYIQYAHARICSIQKFNAEKGTAANEERPDLKRLSSSPEKRLKRKIGEFPAAVLSGAETLEPNKIISYLSDLSRLFHSFYTECRVVSDDAVLTQARLFLVNCVKIVLANGLELLNITMPEKM